MTIDSALILKDLTRFQTATVKHVTNQFFGAPQAKRFLVADETGLGKTMVARGVIAKAIEHLQGDKKVKRIDIVYVCSNADLATQNLRRLNVTGEQELEFASRLTMLAAHSRTLNRKVTKGKQVNLVSFTPGTSFDMGHSMGMARERALILLLLADESVRGLSAPERRALLNLFRGGVRTTSRFGDIVKELRVEIDGQVDPAIAKAFKKAIRSRTSGEQTTSLADIDSLLSDAGTTPGSKLSDALHLRGSRLVRRLRSQLAQASVDVLEPDLVILDEFQRFRHLLDPTTPAGELAHHLFDYEAAKVLLLSATPYKPFTMSGEEGEDHAQDLFATLGFLAETRNDVSVEKIRRDLSLYREAVIAAEPDEALMRRLRTQLLKLMSRAERPQFHDGASMLKEIITPARDLRAEDLAGFASLSRIADLVRQDRDAALVSAEYWKSAPYFANFCDGYKLGQRLNESSRTVQLRSALAAAQQIRATDLEAFNELDPGNARMRELAQQTVGSDWADLLWVPPSLPYLAPGGPYARSKVQGMTKRLVFSSWTATPSAVASILSYEADRHAASGSATYTEYSAANRKRIARHLGYDVKDGKPASWMTVLLHWPMLGLAEAVDPLRLLTKTESRQVDELIEAATLRAETLFKGRIVNPGSSDASPDLPLWKSVLSTRSIWPANQQYKTLAWVMTGAGSQADESDVASPTAATTHAQLAREAFYEGEAVVTREALPDIAQLLLFSPANVSLRSLRRLDSSSTSVTEWGLWYAAAVLANGLRSLFNRPDVIQTLERLKPAGDGPYWRQVLAYSAAGNLEAVLDEYLHILRDTLRTGEVDDYLLWEVAEEAAAALSLRTPTYRAKNLQDKKADLAFAPRFALRYGGRTQDSEDARQPEVRRSFNSPFWPLVLASTSVGQEGIDFHWWCHSVFHWNTPPNPVDFEQREGRVDRYRGHAIRKNIAERHGAEALTKAKGNPWDWLYRAATDERATFGDFSPGWVYPGSAKIERHVAPIALSSDLETYKRVRRDVSLYRLTFGQPRQEDMLELMNDQNLQDSSAFRISLRP